MSLWSPIRDAHNGDIALAYTVGGAGEVDVLVIGGFGGHLEIGPTLPQWACFLAACARSHA